MCLPRWLMRTRIFCWLVEGSPFLARLIRRYPDTLTALSGTPPEEYCQIIRRFAGRYEMQDRDRHCHIASARNRAALAVALPIWPICGMSKPSPITSRAGLTAVRCGLNLLCEAADDGRLKEFSRDGLVVLALGKHGGQELNYSSDIDFVIYYTANALPLVDGQDTRKFHIKLVQDLTALLQNVTADGFVFRVDLRLRPDPGATPVTITVDAALSYYESMGQNWERAVYIKRAHCR